MARLASAQVLLEVDCLQLVTDTSLSVHQDEDHQVPQMKEDVVDQLAPIHLGLIHFQAQDPLQLHMEDPILQQVAVSMKDMKN